MDKDRIKGAAKQVKGIVKEAAGRLTSDVKLEDIQNLLLRKGILTNFQLDRMMTGERLGFYYGPYRVLYMIGAGTFARVFRCVHRETRRSQTGRAGRPAASH